MLAAVGSLDNPSEITRLGPADATPVYYDGRILFPREGGLLAQPFDPVALKTSGTPATVAEDVWVATDLDGLTALAAAADVLVFRRANSGTRQFYWMDAEGHQLEAVGPANTNEARSRRTAAG